MSQKSLSKSKIEPKKIKIPDASPLGVEVAPGMVAAKIKEQYHAMSENMVTSDKVYVLKTLLDDLTADKENQPLWRPLAILRNHKVGIANGAIDWIDENSNLVNLLDLFLVFEMFTEHEDFVFINFEKMRNFLPLSSINYYLSKPFSVYLGESAVSASLTSFSYLLIDAFAKIYVRSLMAEKPLIEYSAIETINPLMRRYIRETNLNYFTEKLDGIRGFKLIAFVDQLIVTFFMSKLSRHVLSDYLRTLVSILNLIELFFSYGLVSLESSKALMPRLTSATEVLRSMEIKNSKIMGDRDDEEAASKEFRTCREKMSCILVHIALLFCDEDLEGKMGIAFRPLGNSATFSRNIFADKVNFAHFSNIAIKYLCRKSEIAQTRESSILRSNLAIIFDFISDRQNDLFSISLSLIQESDYDLCDSMFGNPLDAIYITRDLGDTTANLHSYAKNIKENSASPEACLEEIAQKLFGEFDQYFASTYFSQILMKHLPASNFVILWLSILSFQSDGKDNFPVNKYLNLLCKLCGGNYVGQGMLVQPQALRIIYRLYEKYPVAVLLFLKEVFKSDPTVLCLSSSLYKFISSQYTIIFNKFLELVKEPGVDFSMLPKNPDFQQLIGIVFLFNIILEYFLKGPKAAVSPCERYDIQIAENMMPMLDGLFKLEIEFYENKPNHDLSDLNDIYKLTLIDLDTMVLSLARTDPTTLLARLSYLSLRVLNKSTKRLFTGRIFKSFCQLYESANYFGLKNSPECDLKTRIEFMKVFSKLYVFSNNHILTDRLNIHPHKTSIITERPIPSKFKKVGEFLKGEFAWIEKCINLDTKDEKVKELHIRYLLKGVLLIAYKYVKGFGNRLGAIDKRLYGKIIDVLKNLKEQLMANESFFRSLLPRKDKDEADNDISHLSGTIVSNLKAKLSNKEAQNLKKSNFTPIFESTKKVNTEGINDPDLKMIKIYISQILEGLDTLYNDSNFKHLISEYVDNKVNPNNDVPDDRLFDTFDIWSNIGRPKLIDTEKATADSTYRRVMRHLQRDYKKVKAMFCGNNNLNQFAVTLRGLRDSRQDLELVLGYLIGHFQNLFDDSTITNSKRFYLCNRFFISMLPVLKYMMVNNSDANNQLTKLLTDMDKDEKITILQNMWGLYLLNYLIVSFKTFYDKEHARMLSFFNTYSRFIKSLTEGIDSSFAKLLSDDECKSGAIHLLRNVDQNDSMYTIFLESYILVESVCTLSYSWFNTQPTIQPSDNKEIFSTIKKSFYIVNGFLKGFDSPLPKIIYKYRDDVYNGYINRIIDDVDSDFYHVKLGCIYYIKSLLQAQDNKITVELIQRYDILKSYKIAVQAVKKLFAKYNSILRKSKTASNEDEASTKKKSNKVQAKSYESLDASTFGKTLGKSFVNVEKKVQPVTNEVITLAKLLYMYKHCPEFTDHPILEIATTVLSIISDFSPTVKSMGIFMKYQRELSTIFLSNDYYFTEDEIDEIFIFLFLTQVTQSVEVVLRTEKETETGIETETKLVRIFFKVPSQCLHLTSQTKYAFLENADYTSSQTKHRYLVDTVNLLHEEMMHNKTNQQRLGRLFYFSTSDFFTQSRVFLYMLSVLLNILMFVYLEGDDSQGEYLVPMSLNGKTAINFVAIVLATCSGLLTLLWIYFKFEFEMRCLELKDKTHYSSVMKSYWMIFLKTLKVLSNSRPMSFLFHFIFTVTGLGLGDHFFYTLNLFLLMNLSKTVNYVLESIIKHYGKLLVTMMTAILVIFCYSFIVVRFYRDELDEKYVGICDDFLLCFFNYVNIGLRFESGIPDSLNLYSDLKSNRNRFYGRFFFDLSFLILIKLIFLNLIAGIIIDTFAELRDNMTQQAKSQNDFCYICGLSRWKLVSKGITFKKHVHTDHDLWRYVYFITRLRFTNPIQLDSVEHYVISKLRNDDTSWIPQDVYMEKNAKVQIIKEAPQE